MRTRNLLVSFCLFCALTLVVLLSPTVLRGFLPQQQVGTWASGPSMSAMRVKATATAMYDGRILIAGGEDASGEPQASVDIVGMDGDISPASPMNVPRAGHASVWLYDGYVLVTGGTTRGGGVTNTAEMYDPLTNTWTLLPAVMVDPRSGHSATNLPDGRILIAGGSNGSSPLASVEIFSIVDENFTFAGVMKTPRKNHAAAALQNGEVVLVGGSTDSETLASTVVFNPETNSLTDGPALVVPRQSATATTLLDGSVLVAGGRNPEVAVNGLSELASLEILDVAAGSSRLLPAQMSSARADHAAILLADNNQVVLLGGNVAGSSLNSADLFTPWTGQTRPTPSMSAARAFTSSANLAITGRAMVAGGGSALNTDIYSFATIKTDRTDYLPDMPVNIAGKGWVPGESVSVSITNSGVERYNVNLLADGWGNISDSQFTPVTTDVGQVFFLTATGSASQAQNRFTDGSVTLTVNGAGSVSGSPTPFSPASCVAGSTCTANISAAETLTATGNYVTGWTKNNRITFASGAGCTAGSNTCSFTANGNGGAITVTFAATPTITSMSATTAVAGSAFTLTVNGANYYDGTSKIIFGGAALTTSCSASACSATVPAQGAGTYQVAVMNGTAATSSAQTFTVTNPAATVTLSNLTATYDGAPHAATATTTPAGLNVDITYNGSSTAPKNAGTYNVVATINDPAYSGSTTGTLTINKASATISFDNLNQTYDGSAKSVTATTSPAGLATTITYEGSSSAPTNAGSYNVVAKLNDPNYTGSDATGTFVIAKAPAEVTISNVDQTYDGSAKSVSVSTIPAGLSTSVTYDGGAAAPIDAGSYQIVATVNEANYAGTATASLNIAKAPATVTLSNLSYVYDGTPKSASASTTPSGLPVSITYDGGTTVPSGAGQYAVLASITASNYTGSAGGTLTIAKADQTTSFGALGDKSATDAPFSVSASATSGLAVSFSATGSCSVSGSTVTLTGAGTCTVTANQPGNTNYNAAPSVPQSFAVAGAVPFITWPTPAAITFGTALSSSQLNAVATYNGTALAGTYQYSPAAGTRPSAGTKTLSVTFHPSDASYADANASVELTVNPAPVVVTAPSATRMYGDVNPSLVPQYSGYITGDMSVSAATPATCSATASATSAVGSYPVTCSGASASNYQYSYVDSSLTVTPAPLSVTPTNVSRSQGTANPTLTGTITGIRNSDPITATYTTTATTTSAVGTYPITATLSDGGTGTLANYTVTLNAGTLTVTNDKPDLTESLSIITTNPVAGGTLQVTDVTSNTGPSTAATSVTRIYLVSATTKIATLVARSTSSIAGGSSAAAADSSVTLPINIAGNYSVMACADDNNAVSESDESNNCASLPITVGAPDLVMTSVTVPSSATSGGTVAITDTVANSGVANAAVTSVIRYYLTSGTARLAVLGTRSVPTLVAGNASGPVTTTLGLPANLSGSYTVLACADDTSAVVESNESNNCSSSGSVVVGAADLVEADVSVPSSAVSGASFTAVDQTLNRGAGDAKQSTTRFYLVNGSTRVAVLGTRSVLALAAGASSGSASTSLVLPTNINGVFTVQACADDTLAVAESDESNNCLSSAPIAVTGADLVETQLSVPSAATIGATISVTDAALNQSAAGAKASMTRFYLANGSTKVAVLGTRYLPALAPGGSSGPVSTTVALPSKMTGTFNVIACADDGSAVAESNETNNCTTSSSIVITK